ncbi:G2/mitotic-specific cyclin-A-like [Littorina saxatilis]|uniref:G2/mitotic-specific cyclin-A-like n=1 Tax=Littorina saxatilis TaxID=31220 RepID=UPI0038B49B28
MASTTRDLTGRAKALVKENQSRQAKMATRETRGQKRTVLGSITNNVRKQPSRAAKSAHDVVKVGDENAGVAQKAFGKSSQQTFSIFVDADTQLHKAPVLSHMEDMVEDDAENRMPSLSDAVMRLPTIPQPQSRVPGGSSYFLDMSGVEEEIEDDSDENECVMAQQDQLCSATYTLSSDDRESVIEDVPEYSEDIYSYLLTVEHKNRPRPGFMRRQQDVTMGMRSILVDWLVEVAEEYKLQRETLFLAVNYIDRFLSHMSVLRSKLQLVGASAMFLASKYEEIYPPDVNEFVYITDDTYQKKQILRMEHLILKVLNFDVATPTVNWFVERLLRHVRAEDDVKHMAMYICELVLVDYEKYLVFPSSLVAASALCVANYTLNVQDCWSSQCETTSRYSLKQLAPCVRMLYDLHRDAPEHPQQAVREKYRQTKFDRVADIPAQSLLMPLM